MSNWYSKGLLHCLKGDVTGGLDAADLKAALVESTYTFDDADEVIGDVSPVAATSGVLSGVSVALNGSGYPALDAMDFSFSSVAAGAACNAIVVYWESGAAETRYVLCYCSLAAPVTPDGNNINITLDAGGIGRIVPPAA